MAVLDVSKQGAIAVVTLNRPERRNAFSPEVFARLADAWADIEQDRAIRAAVLTGTGDRAFCSGGDLELLVPLATGARSPQDEWDRRYVDGKRDLVNRALLRRTDFFKPVIAAVNGDAFAGGTEIILSADLRVASSRARFALTEVRRGIIPSGGSLTRLVRQIGWAAANELILVGEPITAERALEIGLVNRVVPPDEVLAVALDLAARVAKGAPLALAKAKEAITRGSGRTIDESFVIEAACGEDVLATLDAREGPRAFLEKREPVFQGR